MSKDIRSCLTSLGQNLEQICTHDLTDKSAQSTLHELREDLHLFYHSHPSWKLTSVASAIVSVKDLLDSVLARAYGGDTQHSRVERQLAEYNDTRAPFYPQVSPLISRVLSNSNHPVGMKLSEWRMCRCRCTHRLSMFRAYLSKSIEGVILDPLRSLKYLKTLRYLVLRGLDICWRRLARLFSIGRFPLRGFIRSSSIGIKYGRVSKDVARERKGEAEIGVIAAEEIYPRVSDLLHRMLDSWMDSRSM